MQPAYMLFLLACLIVLAALGQSLLRRGLRGRRVGDHPVCGRCGFDLFGLPEGQAKCPECGNELSADGAVRKGHRVRRPALIYAGSAALLMFTLVLATEGVKAFRQINWQQMKPTAWLAREARGGSMPAWMELGRRARLGEMSKTHADALTPDALAWQKDVSRTWVPAVGDFVEEARAGKLVSDADWATYCRQAPQFTLQWRAKVRKGDPLPGRVSTGAARVGSLGRLAVRMTSPIESDDPLVLRRRHSGGGGHSQSAMNPTGGGGSSSVYLQLKPEAVAAAPLGKRTTAVKVDVEIRETWDTPGTVAWTQTLSADWELVAADATTVELVPGDNAETRKQIEQGLKVLRLEAHRHPRLAGRHYVNLAVRATAPPVPLSFDAFLRSGEREWKVSTMSFATGSEYHTGGDLPASAGDFDARRVDVVLRPAPDAAARTVDITRVWNGEIVLRDIEVKWPEPEPPSTRP